MGSPLLVTDTSVESVNRALNDMAGKLPGEAGVASAGMMSISTDYTFTPSDNITDLFVTTGATDKTVTLARSVSGRFVRVWKADTGAGEVVVVGNNTGGTVQTINGYSSVRAGLQYQHCDIYQDGTANFVVGQYFQPVALEPSLGTPHRHLYAFQNGGAKNIGTYDIDCSAQVPVGATDIFISCACASGSAGANADIRDTSGDPYFNALVQVAGQYSSIAGMVSLDANRKFRVVVGGANMTDFYLRMFRYWI